MQSSGVVSYLSVSLCRQHGSRHAGSAATCPSHEVQPGMVLVRQSCNCKSCLPEECRHHPDVRCGAFEAARLQTLNTRNPQPVLCFGYSGTAHADVRSPHRRFCFTPQTWVPLCYPTTKYSAGTPPPPPQRVPLLAEPPLKSLKSQNASLRSPFAVALRRASRQLVLLDRSLGRYFFTTISFFDSILLISCNVTLYCYCAII